MFSRQSCQNLQQSKYVPEPENSSIPPKRAIEEPRQKLDDSKSNLREHQRKMIKSQQMVKHHNQHVHQLLPRQEELTQDSIARNDDERRPSNKHYPGMDQSTSTQEPRDSVQSLAVGKKSLKLKSLLSAATTTPSEKLRLAIEQRMKKKPSASEQIMSSQQSYDSYLQIKKVIQGSQQLDNQDLDTNLAVKEAWVTQDTNIGCAAAADHLNRNQSSMLEISDHHHIGLYKLEKRSIKELNPSKEYSYKKRTSDQKNKNLGFDGQKISRDSFTRIDNLVTEKCGTPSPFVEGGANFPVPASTTTYSQTSSGRQQFPNSRLSSESALLAKRKMGQLSPPYGSDSCAMKLLMPKNEPSDGRLETINHPTRAELTPRCMRSSSGGNSMIKNVRQMDKSSFPGHSIDEAPLERRHTTHALSPSSRRRTQICKAGRNGGSNDHIRSENNVADNFQRVNIRQQLEHPDWATPTVPHHNGMQSPISATQGVTTPKPTSTTSKRQTEVSNKHINLNEETSIHASDCVSIPIDCRTPRRNSTLEERGYRKYPSLSPPKAQTDNTTITESPIVPSVRNKKRTRSRSSQHVPRGQQTKKEHPSTACLISERCNEMQSKQEPLKSSNAWKEQSYDTYQLKRSKTMQFEMGLDLVPWNEYEKKAAEKNRLEKTSEMSHSILEPSCGKSPTAEATRLQELGQLEHQLQRPLNAIVFFLIALTLLWLSGAIAACLTRSWWFAVALYGSLYLIPLNGYSYKTFSEILLKSQLLVLPTMALMILTLTVALLTERGVSVSRLEILCLVLAFTALIVYGVFTFYALTVANLISRRNELLFLDQLLKHPRALYNYTGTTTP